MANLRGTYPHLLERIRRQVTLGLAAGQVVPDRAQVTQRAARVALAAREPRLQTFARCLADAVLSDDSWAERVGSFVVSKPPARWTVADETSAIDEIDVLASTFCRVEATAFAGTGDEPNMTAVRLELTNGDGSEVARVVRIRDEDEAAIQELAARVEQVLAEASGLKLATLSRVLWHNLVGGGPAHEQIPRWKSQLHGERTREAP